MKTPCLILVLFLAALIPLGAQNSTGGNKIYGEEDSFLVMEEDTGITIVGSKNTTQQMEVVGRETIEKTHAADLPALLEEAAGLGVTRYGPYGNMGSVNLRGFDSKRTAILIDGVPVNSVRSGDFDFYSIDPSSIERIEIIYGGSDTKYNVSGALGGVINLVTAKKQKSGWSLGGSISNTSYVPGEYTKTRGGVGGPEWQDLADTQNVSVFAAYGAEKYSFRLNLFGNRAENHFLYQDYYDYFRRKKGNEVLDGGVSLLFVRDLPELSKLVLTGALYTGDKNIPVSGYATVYREQKDFSTRENAMLDMPRAFHDDLSMELSLGHNRKKMDYAASRHDENSLLLINRWGWYPQEKITFRFGGDYTFVHIDSTSTGLRNGHRGGLYLAAEYTPVKKLLLIGSVKGVSDGKNVTPVPKLGLAWTVNNHLTLKNNYFRSFKFPDFDDLYWMENGFTGNPDLKNEDGWGADLGAEISVNDWFTFNSTVFGEWTDNSIHWSNMPGSGRPENSGTAAFFGWDNTAKCILPFSFGSLGKPVLTLSWLFQLSWLLSGSLSFEDKLCIPYMPVHTLGISLELPWESKAKKLQGSVIVSGRYESARYADVDNITMLNPYFLLNIIFNQKLNNNFNLFGRINNVLNANYVSFADYPMPGISLTFGINMVFESIGKDTKEEKRD